MNADQPSRPANILNIVAINQGHQPLTMDTPGVAALSPAAFDELRGQGHLVIDTRASDAFGAGHIPEAYHLKGASPEFEQRVGWIVPLDKPLLLVADDAAHVARALHKLAFVGIDGRVAGSLDGGMAAWVGAGMPQTTVAQISVQELEAALQNGDGMKVLDVREPAEWAVGHVDGAAMMSFKMLAGHLEETGVAADDHVAVVCAGGVRSSTACSILQRAGYRHVRNVTGGMGAWNAAGLSTVPLDEEAAG